MNKLSLEQIDERLRKLELSIEKIIIIQNNIQENYLHLYEEIKLIREDIKKLSISEKELETNIQWLTKLKNYGLLGGGIVGGLYLVYEFLKKL